MVTVPETMANNFQLQNYLDSPNPKPPKTKDFHFRPENLGLYLRAYIRPHRIAVPGDTNTSSVDLSIITLPDMEGQDPWGWKRSLAECKLASQVPCYAFMARRRKFGGDGLDVSTWTSDERAKYSYMGEGDAFPADIMDKIKRGIGVRILDSISASL